MYLLSTRGATRYFRLNATWKILLRRHTFITKKQWFQRLSQAPNNNTMEYSSNHATHLH